MCLEIWNMRIAVSNVLSEYSLGGVSFTDSGYRHESSRLLTFGDFSQQAAVATVLSLIEYGI